MGATLAEVLALPSFRAAQTEVLHGDAERVRVRWVHSSEVFEMGPLLAGGEVLLTTGLGLHGRTADHLASYVDQLADAGVAALALELGRTFFAVPEPILATARRRDLALLAFPTMVPFERMVEDFHELLVRRRVASGGDAGDAGWRALTQVVIEERGLRALLDEVSRLAGCAVELRDPDGQTVERSRIASVSEEDVGVSAPVRGPAGPLGTLRLLGEESADRTRLAEVAAHAVALEVGRGSGPGHRPGPAQSLLSDLVAGVVASRADVLARLAALGWPPQEGRHLVVAAIEVDSAVPLTDAVAATEAAFHEDERSDPAVLVGLSGAHLVVVHRGGRRPVPAQVRDELRAAHDRLAARLPGRVLVAAATPVADPGDLALAVARARQVLRTARRYGRRDGVVMERDVAAHRLVTSSVEPAVMRAFVREQIGPLVDHDREHRTELLRTLDAYLACSLSKARTAQLLGIRRQSLYDRLARVERLLGVSLDEPDHRTGLGLALLGWRMRTGLDPQVGFGG
ncbi:PucR family transcriptional regulator [Nocardioides albidus]|uniref:PucR family transcriptional regulator n=1 Tax=Nocardioides albidus TaxID=1517589 RepID=A0A5C4WIL9_9ACTN|nr:PucR family transcriptional regulator [Nocardioides albidus]TNM48158.1 PucR family transcriptional regulator [Nocardioides albidus]